MDSEDEEGSPPLSPAPSLFDVLEQLESHLNIAALTRLKLVDKSFYKRVDDIISWRPRGVAFHLNLSKRRSPADWRLHIVKRIQKYKNRCCECGSNKARFYGQKHSVCDSCRYDITSYRALATRRDIQCSFKLTSYKMIMFCRHLTPVHGGSCSSPFLYWVQDVNRTYRRYQSS
jgi:hypothetical protein